MFVHIVFFRLSRTDAETTAWLKHSFEGLGTEIPVIRDIQFGINEIPSDRAWDAALWIRFDDKTDLAEYRRHPAHVRVVHAADEVTRELSSVDYSVDGD